MGLTVDDHIPLRLDAPRRQAAFEVLDQAHVAPAVDQVQPIEVRGPRNMPVILIPPPPSVKARTPAQAKGLLTYEHQFYTISRPITGGRRTDGPGTHRHRAS